MMIQVVNDEWHAAGSLRTMNRVFQQMNVQFVNGSVEDDWDVLWSVEHPFPGN